MVSQNTITGLDFQTIEQYFEYVIESRINGQFQQAESLIEKMSKPQKKTFIEYIDENHPDCKDASVVKMTAFKSL